MERLGCRRLGDLLGYSFGLCFALGGDSGGGQIGGLLGGGIVRQLLEDFGQVILGIESLILGSGASSQHHTARSQTFVSVLPSASIGKRRSCITYDAYDGTRTGIERERQISEPTCSGAWGQAGTM